MESGAEHTALASSAGAGAAWQAFLAPAFEIINSRSLITITGRWDMKLSSLLLFIEQTKSIVSMSAYERKYELKETDYVHVDVSNFQGRKSHGSWLSTHTCTHTRFSLSSASTSSLCVSYYVSFSLSLLHYWHFKQLTREHEACWLAIMLRCFVSHPHCCGHTHTLTKGGKCS